MDQTRIFQHARTRYGADHLRLDDTFADALDQESPGVRTDLALEAHQLATRRGKRSELPGVSTEEEDLGFGTVTRTVVQNDMGAQLIGKPQGRYVTIQIPQLHDRRRELAKDAAMALADEIRDFMSDAGLSEGGSVLVIGLGNWNATPDNVGPLTASKLLVTRHLHEYQVLDEEILGQMRSVAALSPGVLGLTGVETAEIVRGVVDRVKPDLVICIDALASMSIDRVGTTFQLSNVGINPGSGVGNTRRALTRDTLGVPVLAIGCPTVIYATTIVSDALDRLGPHMAPQAGNGSPEPGRSDAPAGLLDPTRIVVSARSDTEFSGSPVSANIFDSTQRQAILKDVLGKEMGHMIVTPKEVDLLVETLTDMLADGLNEALHPGLSAEEAAQLR